MSAVIIGEGHHVVGITFVFGQDGQTLGLQSVIVPHQPFYGDFGIGDGGEMTAIQREKTAVDGLRGEAMHAQVPIASQRDGHLFEGIESSV